MFDISTGIVYILAIHGNEYQERLTMTMTIPAYERIDRTSTEPVHYGWRFVQRDLPEGGYVIDEVPLTLEDVLYPEEGDQVTHSSLHQRIVRYLVSALEAQFRNDPSVAVLDDIRIAWDDPELRPNGPDIAVIFGVREQQTWATFDVGKEGVRPTLLIEVTSPETRGIDLVTKVDIFAQAGVDYYVIIDIQKWKGVDAFRLLGHQLTPNGYAILSPDARGWLWFEPIGLWLGRYQGQVWLFTPEGKRIGTYTEVDAARQAAEERAKAEQRARLVAEERAKAEQHARLVAEERAATAEERATTAEEQAQIEAAARADAEQRLAALEAELKRLRGEA
jgi:colicin import membrane protein